MLSSTSEELNADTALALAALEPFGSGNPRPRLLVVDATLEDAAPTRNGLHLRCRVRSGGVQNRRHRLRHGQAAGHRRVAEPTPRLVGAQLRVDEWQGTLRPQLRTRVRRAERSRRARPAAGCGPECPVGRQRASRA